MILDGICHILGVVIIFCRVILSRNMYGIALLYSVFGEYLGKSTSTFVSGRL